MSSKKPGIIESLVLLLIAIILVPVFGSISFLIAIGKLIFGKYSKELFSRYILDIAIGNDQTGNTLCAPLFNMILFKKGGYYCGTPDETVSGVIGKNEKRNTLTIAGKILNWILNKLDPGHSIDSIEHSEDWNIKY